MHDIGVRDDHRMLLLYTSYKVSGPAVLVRLRFSPRTYGLITKNQSKKLLSTLKHCTEEGYFKGVLVEGWEPLEAYVAPPLRVSRFDTGQALGLCAFIFTLRVFAYTINTTYI